jgi:hypothetical protein
LPWCSHGNRTLHRREAKNRLNQESPAVLVDCATSLPAAEVPGLFISTIPERRQLSVGSSGVPASSL